MSKITSHFPQVKCIKINFHHVLSQHKDVYMCQELINLGYLLFRAMAHVILNMPCGGCTVNINNYMSCIL